MSPRSPHLALEFHSSWLWPAGLLATEALKGFIVGRPVACKVIARDVYDRLLATCTAGDDDLSALMVASGWAWTERRSFKAYQDAERRAAAKGRGVHGHDCVKP